MPTTITLIIDMPMLHEDLGRTLMRYAPTSLSIRPIPTGRRGGAFYTIAALDEAIPLVILLGAILFPYLRNHLNTWNTTHPANPIAATIDVVAESETVLQSHRMTASPTSMDGLVASLAATAPDQQITYRIRVHPASDDPAS